MPTFTAIGLGEILWDVLPEGRKLGGAPANFAYHVSALGGTGFPVSRIGDDDLGREALEVLRKHDVITDHISIDPNHPTGTVDATVDTAGVATYTFPDAVAWDYLFFDAATLGLAATANVICFGTLAQRSEISRKAIHSFLSAAPNALKVYDINLRQNFYSAEIIQTSLTQADVLKINDDELRVVADMFSLPSGEEASLVALVNQYDLKLGVLTRGGEGSLILSRNDKSELPGQPTTVVDTIGAGDSFSAALALAYLHGHGLDEINRYATSVAAFVCGQAGAMPVMPESLRISALSTE
ncbi:carbohydrate kinase [Pseudodesulfovibrio sp.]|nr:carbohydrate kinase [Pseudodesulfovibrio sp.]